jgi:hypothetical protein
MPGRDDEMDDASRRTVFAVLAAKLASEIRMPTVVNFDVLPNMGRMTPRLPGEGKPGYSWVPIVVATALR